MEESGELKEWHYVCLVASERRGYSAAVGKGTRGPGQREAKGQACVGGVGSVQGSQNRTQSGAGHASTGARQARQKWQGRAAAVARARRASRPTARRRLIEGGKARAAGCAGPTQIVASAEGEGGARRGIKRGRGGTAGEGSRGGGARAAHARKRGASARLEEAHSQEGEDDSHRKHAHAAAAGGEAGGGGGAVPAAGESRLMGGSWSTAGRARSRALGPPSPSLAGRLRRRCVDSPDGDAGGDGARGRGQPVLAGAGQQQHV